MVVYRKLFNKSYPQNPVRSLSATLFTPVGGLRDNPAIFSKAEFSPFHPDPIHSSQTWLTIALSYPQNLVLIKIPGPIHRNTGA